ncbi:MAG: hypothetical protein ABSF26_02755 [Thermoguttaceae bacterium]
MRLSSAKSNTSPLDRVQRLAKIVAARVDEVVSGDVPSFFFFGPGGHGKSHVVSMQLDRKPGPGKWLHWNSRMTPRALVEQLFFFRHQVHLFEDMEDLYKDKTSAGILRSACASVRGAPRRITYTTARGSFDFVFEGGVIVISNEDLSGNGVIGAVASRMRPLLWQLRPDEIVAIIRDSAAKGYTHRGHLIPPAECHEVAEYVIDAMQSGRVDLRAYFDHALPSYWYWKHAKAPTVHWTDIVKSKIVGEPVIEKRHDRVEREREIACRCFTDANNTEARLGLWKQRTGWSRQVFYNRLREAKATGMLTHIVRVAS